MDRLRRGGIGFLALLLFFFAWTAESSAQRRAKEACSGPIRIQLKWLHQFQFAGYYAALEKGYFKEAGLDVRLIEGGPTRDPVHAVVEGDADFGIGNSTLIVDRSKGLPVVAVAAIFQHSPFVIIARRDDNLVSVRDLEGRTLMVEEHAAEIFAYLKLAGVDLDKVKMVPHTGDVTVLAPDHPSGIDAATAYTSTEPFFAIQADIPFRIFNPRDEKIDFYGDTLFTSKRCAEANPEVVRAVRKAVIRGWAFANSHQDEIISLILEKYAPDDDRLRLGFEAQITHDLIATDFVDLGYMSLSRWRHIADTFARAGMMPPDVTLDGFVFDSEMGLPDWVYEWLAWMGLLAAVSIVAAHRFFLLNRNLKREIASRKALEKALKFEIDTKDKLFSIVSHDLQSPFTSLLGMTQLMSSRATQFSREELVAFAADVNEAGNRVFGLLQNLLEWSRLQLRGGEPEPETLPVEEVVNESLEILRALAERKGLALRVAVDGSAVFADRNMLLTVFRNLVANAVKFTPAGGSIVISSEREGDAVRITVSDTGVGMTPEKVDEVFSLSSQTSTPGTAGEGGTGLGLPLSKDMVERCGGDIRIESAPGAGTRVHVILPVAGR